MTSIFVPPLPNPKRTSQEAAALVHASETTAHQPGIPARHLGFGGHCLRRCDVFAHAFENICRHLLLHCAFEFFQFLSLATHSKHVVFKFEGLNEDRLRRLGRGLSQRDDFSYAHGCA